MPESRNVFAAIFSTKPRLILKPENAMKYLESRKNCIAEYQARQTALGSMDQSQVCTRAGSKCSCLPKKPLKCQKNPRDANRPI